MADQHRCQESLGCLLLLCFLSGPAGALRSSNPAARSSAHYAWPGGLACPRLSPAGALRCRHSGAGSGGEAASRRAAVAAAICVTASLQLPQNTDGFLQPLNFPFGTVPFRPQLRKYSAEIGHVISLCSVVSYGKVLDCSRYDRGCRSHQLAKLGPGRLPDGQLAVNATGHIVGVAVVVSGKYG